MMTPRENYEAVLAGKKPDELPVYVANTSAFLRGYYGVTGRELVDDVETHVEVTSKFVKEYDFASVAVVAYIFFGCGPEMGVEWKFSGDDLPGAVAGPLKSEPDLAKLSVPQKPTGYFKRYLEILARLQREMGDRVFFNGSVQGPHTNGCFLRGVETALMDPIDGPDFYQRYMKFCVELSEYFGVHVLDLGLPHNVMLEIFLTPDMIGPDYYYEHVAPYSHEVVDHFAALGKKLPNPLETFIGRPNEPESSKTGKFLFDYFFGTKGSLDVIRKAGNISLPGFPAIITLSGEMMVSWSASDLTDFLKAGLEIMIKEFTRYPAVRMTSLQPPDHESALKMSEKIRAICEVAKSYAL